MASRAVSREPFRQRSLGDDVGLSDDQTSSLQQGEDALSDARTVGPDDRDMAHPTAVVVGGESLHGCHRISPVHPTPDVIAGSSERVLVAWRTQLSQRSSAAAGMNL